MCITKWSLNLSFIALYQTPARLILQMFCHCLKRSFMIKKHKASFYKISGNSRNRRYTINDKRFLSLVTSSIILVVIPTQIMLLFWHLVKAVNEIREVLFVELTSEERKALQIQLTATKSAIKQRKSGTLFVYILWVVSTLAHSVSSPSLTKFQKDLSSSL